MATVLGQRLYLNAFGATFSYKDSAPALDLVEIGRAVSERVSVAGEQTPVVWGLNLYGPPGFCRESACRDR